MAQRRQVHRQPAEGVVRRRGDARRTTTATTGCRGSPAIIRIRATGSTWTTASWKGCSCSARTRRSADRTRGSNGAAMANLDWLVVRDLVEIETASFWYDSPEVERGELRPEDIKTEVFLMPAASPRREGRLLHEHAAAAAVAREGGRSAGRCAQRTLVHLSPRTAAEGEGGARPAAAQRRA